ncbi:MAG: DUF2946 family protein [Deltaproteobacteria bacterium]
MWNWGTIRNLRRVRAWLGHALALAVILRALIPAGFMPVFAEHEGGGLKIVICTAHGTKLVSTDQDGRPDDRSVEKHTSEPCAFVPMAVFTPPDVIVTPAPAVHHDPVLTFHAAVTLPPARAGPANGSRAPPTLT